MIRTLCSLLKFHYLLALLPALLIADEPPVSVTGGAMDDVEVTATYSRDYPDNHDIEIWLEIGNHSEDLIQSIRTNGVDDVAVELTAPDGARIPGYHEMEGSRFGRDSRRRRIIDRIGAGEKKVADPVPISSYWPLEKAGEYRCVLIKRVYRLKKAELESTEHKSWIIGAPVDIRLPEFRFRIEKIDKDFVPLGAVFMEGVRKKGDPPARREILSDQERPIDFSSIGWSAVLLIACVFLGWRIFMRKPLP